MVLISDSRFKAQGAIIRDSCSGRIWTLQGAEYPLCGTYLHKAKFLNNPLLLTRPCYIVIAVFCVSEDWFAATDLYFVFLYLDKAKILNVTHYVAPLYSLNINRGVPHHFTPRVFEPVLILYFPHKFVLSLYINTFWENRGLRHWIWRTLKFIQKLRPVTRKQSFCFWPSDRNEENNIYDHFCLFPVCLDDALFELHF